MRRRGACAGAAGGVWLALGGAVDAEAATHQIVLGPALTVTFGAPPGSDAAPVGVGLALQAEYQRLAGATSVSTTLAPAPSYGVYADLELQRMRYFVGGAGLRMGFGAAQVANAAHVVWGGGEFETGLAASSRGVVGVNLGLVATGLVANARLHATIPFVGEALRPTDLTVSVGASVPVIPTIYAVPGRPLRIGGVPAWVRPPDADGDALRWATAAQVEAASVPAFLRLAAQLRALGAPSDLVRAARAAAAEEVGHAWLCAAMAARAGLRGWHPSAPPMAVGPLRADPALLAQVAAESWVDGVRNEGRAAVDADAAAEATDDPVERAVQSRIATEEAGHAALAARIVRWCRGQDRGGVDAALDAIG